MDRARLVLGDLLDFLIDRAYDLAYAVSGFARAHRRASLIAGVAALVFVVALAASCSAGSDGDAQDARDGAAAEEAGQALEGEAQGDGASQAATAAASSDHELLSLGDDGVLTVVLDPGHGGDDGGADDNGLVEKTLCWAIAQYCKEALEAVPGVQVVLTREKDECPSLDERAQVAADVGADVLVSLHINSNEYATWMRGATVYCQTALSSYLRSTTAEPSEVLGRLVLERLVALGLDDNGVVGREVEFDPADESNVNLVYPEGESGLSDYYGVLRGARKLGVPAIIVEHVFQSNEEDAAMLSMNSFLRALGEADAAAILDAYGLLDQ